MEKEFDQNAVIHGSYYWICILFLAGRGPLGSSRRSRYGPASVLLPNGLLTDRASGQVSYVRLEKEECHRNTNWCETQILDPESAVPL